MKQGAAAAIFVAATIAAVDRRPVHAGAQLELVAAGRNCEEADAASPLLLRDAVGRNWLLVPFVAKKKRTNRKLPSDSPPIKSHQTNRSDAWEVIIIWAAALGLLGL